MSGSPLPHLYPRHFLSSLPSISLPPVVPTNIIFPGCVHHQLLALLLHVGRDKRSEVHPGRAIQDHFIVDQSLYGVRWQEEVGMGRNKQTSEQTNDVKKTRQWLGQRLMAVPPARPPYLHYIGRQGRVGQLMLRDTLTHGARAVGIAVAISRQEEWEIWSISRHHSSNPLTSSKYSSLCSSYL